MKYPRRVQVQGQRALVNNPKEERELLEKIKAATTDDSKLAGSLGDESLGLLIQRKANRIDNRLSGPSKVRAEAWTKRLQDDDELFLYL